MSEITEQIQNPAVSAFPLAEIPAEPAATVPLEPQTPKPKPSAEDESALSAQINELWRLHVDYAASMRSQSQNLQSLRTELGKKLSQMKQVLACPGRNGQWSGWLKERKIPRATADRLVTKFERSLNPDRNRLTGSISEPTEEEINTLLDKTVPKLHKVLRTPASAYRFLDLLSSSLALNRKGTENGFIVFKPSKPTGVEQPVPDAVQVETVQVIADLPAKEIVESVDVSMVL